MDYYKLENIQADTNMQEALGKDETNDSDDK